MHIVRTAVFMRLDKYLAESGVFSRSEAGKAVRGGRITVDGKCVRDPSAGVDELSAEVCADGVRIRWTKYKYIMLNKPENCISSTDDPRSVMKLLPPECMRLGMFPCGRLDVDTVGLLLITNDGPTAHELLSPKHHREKTYRFRCSSPINDEMKTRLEEGIEFSDFTSKPCKVIMHDPYNGEITVTEGKFHQIKRMLHAVGSEITFLERLTFAGLHLDDRLSRGEWRYLTDDEIKVLCGNG